LHSNVTPGRCANAKVALVWRLKPEGPLTISVSPWTLIVTVAVCTPPHPSSTR
jgi:hypothetical protein